MEAIVRPEARLAGSATRLAIAALFLLSAGPARAARADVPAAGGDSAVVVLLGTGTPRPDPLHHGPATAIVIGPRVLLFDAGPGVGSGPRVSSTKLRMPDGSTSARRAAVSSTAARGYVSRHSPYRTATGPWRWGGASKPPGRTIVISGDTRDSKEVAKQARGVDVLVHEVYAASAVGPETRPGGEDWPRYMKEFHTSDEELGRVAAGAKPKLLILTHAVYRARVDNEAIGVIRRAGYEGRVVIGEDLGRCWDGADAARSGEPASSEPPVGGHPARLPGELTMNAVMMPKRAATAQPGQPPRLMPMKVRSRMGRARS